MSSQEKEGISWREEFNVRNSLQGVRRAVRAKRGKLGLVKEYGEEITRRQGTAIAPTRKPGACAHSCSDLLEVHHVCCRGPRSKLVRSSHWRCCCFCSKKPLSEPRCSPCRAPPWEVAPVAGKRQGQASFFLLSSKLLLMSPVGRT